MLWSIVSSISSTLSLAAVAGAAVIPPPNTLVTPGPSDLARNQTSLLSGAPSLGRPPRDPFDVRIASTNIGLRFSRYGSDVDSSDILDCFEDATEYVDAVLDEHGDGPIPTDTRLHWFSGTLSLDIHHDSRLTYRALSLVLIAAINIESQYGWFETHFQIFHQDLGDIGYGDILQTQHPSTLSSSINSSTSSAPPQNNTSSLANDTSSRFRIPPPAPFTWRIPDDPTLAMEFTDFGHPLHQRDVLDTYIAAAKFTKAAIRAAGRDGAIPGDPRPLHWSTRTVMLTIQHGPKMTWGVLADVLGSLTALGIRYGYSEATFLVVREREGILGAGTLAFKRWEE